MNTQINQKLYALAESDYKAFNQKLIPTNYEILGIRMPALKKLAKELAANPEVDSYLRKAEYTSYEHILLYGLVLGQLKNPSLEKIWYYLDPLILRFDNWAHVDTLISFPKLFKKYPDEVLQHFLPLKTHEGEFTKRTFVIFLMDHCMDETRIDSTLKHLSEVPQGQYYVDMGLAWAISNGLIKFYDRTLPSGTKSFLPVRTQQGHPESSRKLPCLTRNKRTSQQDENQINPYICTLFHACSLRYSFGVYPTFFLKRRLKCCEY